MKRSTLPMVNTQMQAADIIAGKLRSADFSENDTSALFPNKGGTRDFAHKNETEKPEDVGTGGVIGGTIGLFAGMGELALLGSGAFIAAGSVIAGLSGAAMSSISGDDGTRDTVEGTGTGPSLFHCETAESVSSERR